MKNSILYIIVVAFATLLLASCEKEIEFKGEQTDPKLVVNCVCTVGEPVVAQLSKSYFFLDPDGNTEAPDATKVQLYVNDNYVGEMIRFEDSLWGKAGGDVLRSPQIKLFRNDYCPKTGDRIKITASAPGFDAVEACTSPMPEPAGCVISDFVLTGEPTFESWYDDDGCQSFHYIYKADVMLDVSDPNPGRTDYFVLNVAVEWQGEHQWNANVWAEYNDPVFGNGGLVLGELSENSNRNNSFTDLLFDGKTYKVKVPVKLNLYGYSAPDSVSPVLSMRVEHLTKEYYNYLTTVSLQGDEVMGAFAEPVHVFSNVQDGYGIVGGTNVSKAEYQLPLVESQPYMECGRGNNKHI